MLAGSEREAEKALIAPPETAARVERVLGLADGFESAYGMELLASVHWVGTHEDPNAATDADLPRGSFGRGRRERAGCSPLSTCAPCGTACTATAGWRPGRPRISFEIGKPSYARFMSSGNARDELRGLVDRIPPAELRRILRLVIGELASAASRRHDEAAREERPPAPGGARRRRLSFAGIIEDDPDAARRSEEILREGFRRPASC